ncbi:MAG: hypothetical protein S4CHLAM7_09530 [Chlamydiae bacterium]|nr:hypothetical protein [Chlamydiota bacterium]
MKKVNRRQMQSIQKKVIKEVRHIERKESKNPNLVSTKNGLILCMSSSMKDLLKVGTSIYELSQRQKQNHFRKKRPVKRGIK